MPTWNTGVGIKCPLYFLLARGTRILPQPWCRKQKKGSLFFENDADLRAPNTEARLVLPCDSLRVLRSSGEEQRERERERERVRERATALEVH